MAAVFRLSFHVTAPPGEQIRHMDFDRLKFLTMYKLRCMPIVSSKDSYNSSL